MPQDDAEAARWYRRAAEQGDALAQRNLGTMYILGKGVPQDDVEAYKWLNLSAAQGNESAKKNRDFASKRLTPEQRAQAQQLAREWKPKPESPGK